MWFEGPESKSIDDPLLMAINTPDRGRDSVVKYLDPVIFHFGRQQHVIQNKQAWTNV